MLKQRGGYWYIDIRRRGHTPIRRSTGIAVDGSKPPAEAQELHDKLASESWRVAKLGDRPKRTWAEAALRWVEESRKRSAADDLQKIDVLQKWIKHWKLDDFTWDRWSVVLESLKRERQVSDTTLNRYTNLVRAVLMKAHTKWRWIDAPHILPRFEEPEPRKRFLTPEEAEASFAKLAPWARDLVLFDVATGLRQGNLLALRWSWIDLQQRVVLVPAAEFKQGRSHGVPLSEDAIKILRRQIGKHGEFVFVKDGRPVTKSQITWAWQQAVRGLPGPVTFHTLRKTWASWLRQCGVSIGDITAAGGWSSSAIVESTYAHITPAHLLPVVNKLSGVVQSLENLTQMRHTSPVFCDTTSKEKVA